MALSTAGQHKCRFHSITVIIITIIVIIISKIVPPITPNTIGIAPDAVGTVPDAVGTVPDAVETVLGTVPELVALTLVVGDCVVDIVNESSDECNEVVYDDSSVLDTVIVLNSNNNMINYFTDLIVITKNNFNLWHLLFSFVLKLLISLSVNPSVLIDLTL